MKARYEAADFVHVLGVIYNSCVANGVRIGGFEI